MAGLVGKGRVRSQGRMGETLMASGVLQISVQEICEQEGLTRAVLLELVEYDIARPVAGTSLDDWVFDNTGAHWLRKANRLRRELDLDWLAVSVLVELLRQRETLDQENRMLRQRLRRLLNDLD